jgi:hypothetical protein
VDAWEGKVNAWPLDEGLIDYVSASYGTESDKNPYYSANIIANPKLTLSGRVLDTREITKQTPAEKLHEIDSVETNVATGYHAIEFLLWGQDLNGTGPGAGTRSASDYDTNNCSNRNCRRRADYLKAVTALLVEDLGWMVEQWSNAGAARHAVTDGIEKRNLGNILSGMGSLSYGELAGERMKLGLLLHDPEEEHDCFSDNTQHRRHAELNCCAHQTLFNSGCAIIAVVVFSPESGTFAVSSPRGGLVTFWSAEGVYLGHHDQLDVCELCPDGDGFIVSDGNGKLIHIHDSLNKSELKVSIDSSWDNHLRSL